MQIAPDALGTLSCAERPYAQTATGLAVAIGNSSHNVKTDAVIVVRCPSWAGLVGSPNPHAPTEIDLDLESPNGPVAAQN